MLCLLKITAYIENDNIRDVIQLKEMKLENATLFKKYVDNYDKEFYFIQGEGEVHYFKNLKVEMILDGAEITIVKKFFNMDTQYCNCKYDVICIINNVKKYKEYLNTFDIIFERYKNSFYYTIYNFQILLHTVDIQTEWNEKSETMNIDTIHNFFALIYLDNCENLKQVFGTDLISIIAGYFLEEM